ncbi:phenylalanyl-tRNA synthetase [Buchnera aphidicola (Schlechtendalia chinensis)]|uniref:Phenylalanine--tRNA ligase alpha subunit n=1 Tax=Buchnera aphidicola subsp. Schlechtendalia chinensis TaxID=118110 RepID=A0A172WD95_BUCSC|nr:phenylalanine--tRNA ligase subunit alpha [Buchnera aphidicola]ANF16934.1 phenylalanyl-tRNA synthetase [Buchnera aphidicola (Schlechtendalia chinensis)]
MFNSLKCIKSITLEIQKTRTLDELELLRVKYLGKNGYIPQQMLVLKSTFLKKKKFGVILNKLKTDLLTEIDSHKKKLELCNINIFEKKEFIDTSMHGRRSNIGTLHPITTMINKIENFFLKLGFKIVQGHEIDDEYHNFDALNISKNHPSRTDHDTFWFDSNRLLRTQTSNMQIRSMKEMSLPIKIIVPGKVYRNDHDTTHTPMFHQVEGLLIDRNVNFSNLKWIIESFLGCFFNNSLKIRFRPSYFPFTFLSSEVDILEKNNRWLEILGCGMVHPNVLKNVGIDSKIYSGYAFGLGVERISMLHHGISDIRIFFENDLKFLKQFK